MRFSTSAQVIANQANAQSSTGPKTAAGKAIVSQNNLQHGLAGAFRVLDWENHEDYRAMQLSLEKEHQPATPTEEMLVENMARSYWLRKRALILQNTCFTGETPVCSEPKDLALYIRYQNTHDRAFHRALNDLLKLRAEKRKQEIGFESQAHKQAEETRRQARETRKQDLHEYAVLLAGAKVDHQWVLTANQRLPQLVAAAVEEQKLAAQKAA
jgi:low affinity Fe/Cu permease